jgi:hypothetical protein
MLGDKSQYCVRSTMILRLILSAIIALVFASAAHATGSLDFKAGEYYLNMTVSLETMSIVDPIYFSSAQTSSPIVIEQKQFKTFRYDIRKKYFKAAFINSNDTASPQSFTVIVRGKRGALNIAGKKIPFITDWRLL